MENTHTYLESKTLGENQVYRLLINAVIPRPIAWITTMNTNGIVNAAPFSSYTYVCIDPPMVGVNISTRNGYLKDTARNLRVNGEFVVNVPSEEDLEKMHRSSEDFLHEESEASILGLSLIDSVHILPPRIASTSIQMECRLTQFLTLGNGKGSLYIGEVIAFHVANWLFDGKNIDSSKLKAISRLGGPYYAKLGEILNRTR